MFCAVTGVGTEVVGGHAVSVSGGCDDVRATVCGVSGQRALSGLCHPHSVDGVTSHREACVAWGVAADATPGADCRAASFLCDCLGRSRLVCAVAVSADRALGMAPGVTDQYRRDISA